MKQVVTIAGSDSGAGAGIQADLKTFHALGVYGTSAITAVTAQNTRAINVVHKVPPQVVAAQIVAVLSDFDITAAKTGVLLDADTVGVVVDVLAETSLRGIVVDPVLASTSGHELLDEAGLEVLRKRLLPLAILVTPNLRETAILSGMDVSSDDDLATAAARILDMGCRGVLITGGHSERAPGVDIYYDDKGATRVEPQLLFDGEVHGSGCTLSAAITARLALGDDPLTAIHSAKRYLEHVCATPPQLGRGAAPADHFRP